MIELTSDLALRVYRQVFFGIDQPFGYTLGADGDEPSAERPPVRIDEASTWYVRHNDDRISDSFVRKELVPEVKEKGIPGLSLAGCRQLTDSGFGSLQQLLHLETLDLFNTNLSNKDIEPLTALQSLTSLNLAGTLITDDGVGLLKNLVNLEKLHLGWTEITDAALLHIKQMKSLKWLDLRNTKITDSGLSHIAEMKWLENLGLEETGIHNQGINDLKPLNTSLVRLYLGYTRITDESLNILKTFTRLRLLMLRGTQVSREYDAELMTVLRELGGVGTGPNCIQEGLIR